MKTQHTHHPKVLWSFMIGIFVAFSLLFSVSSYASINYTQMQVKTVSSMDASSNAAFQNNTNDVSEQNDCCENKDDSLCNSNDDCTTPCMSFGISHAVLTKMDNVTSTRSDVVVMAYHAIKIGVFSLINVPPPRG